jgi:hypothetical protein
VIVISLLEKWVDRLSSAGVDGPNHAAFQKKKKKGRYCQKEKIHADSRTASQVVPWQISQ